MVTNTKNIIDSIVKENVRLYGLDNSVAQKLTSQFSLLDAEKLTYAHKKVQEHLAQEEAASLSLA